MSGELRFFKHNLAFWNIIDTLSFKFRQAKEHPERMCADGIICFCGEQGSGKTLSAMHYVYSLASAFPLAKVVTNVGISWDLENEVLPYTGPEDMLAIDNGEYGVIFFLDEMHIEFNSLESKGMDANIFELVSQQRKARKHIVGTSQVFGRLAKPFREQFKFAVCCDNFLGVVFRQIIYKATNIASGEDITTKLTPRATRIYFPKPSDFDLYDTTQIIRRIRNDGFDRT
ncbi:MAG: ATP-binding protein [Lachnospiraceae bacterium]|nr:ATP-binding protein [Lachnospiraceae bacterium]